MTAPAPLWPYTTPGIPDNFFERLPGIPLTKREVRLLLISYLRMRPDSVLWDIGAGTGTIAIEVALLCPQSTIVAIERDDEVADLIRSNCQRFGVENVRVVEGSAPDCLANLEPLPHRVCLEGGRNLAAILTAAWHALHLQGRIVATANNLENLYRISESLAELQARNIEVVQSAFNRLEKRGSAQIFAAADPTFVLSGEKL